MANEKYISSIKLDNIKYNVKQKDAALLSDIYEDTNGDLTQYEIFSKPADFEKGTSFNINTASYSASNSGEVTLEVNDTLSFDVSMDEYASYAKIKIDGIEVYNLETDGRNKSIEATYVHYLTFDTSMAVIQLANFYVKKPKFLLKDQYASYEDNFEDALNNLGNHYSVGSFDYSYGFEYNSTNHTFGGDNYNITFSANNKPYHIVIDLNNDYGSFNVSYNGQSWNSTQSPIVDITTDGTHNVVLTYYMATSIKITTFEISNGKVYESGIITGQKKEEYDNAASITYVDTALDGKLNTSGGTMTGNLSAGGHRVTDVGMLTFAGEPDGFGDIYDPSIDLGGFDVDVVNGKLLYSSYTTPSDNGELICYKQMKDCVDTYHGNGTVIGSAGFVYGTNSSVGGKGMPIVDYNGTIGEEGTYTLSNVTQEFADRIAIGDIVSIVMKGNFDCWSKVTSVVYEAVNEIIKLTVDTFFTNEKDVSTGDTTSYDAHKTYSSSGKLTYAPEMGFAIQNPSEKQVYIYIVGKPDVGSVLLADGGASFGEDVIVQGKDSFGSGYNIWVGKYAVAIGKNVKAAYGDFAAGRDIDLSEAQVSSAMGNNLKIGGFASGTTLFGKYLESNRSNQTVVGTYNNFRYDDVFEIGVGNTFGRKNAFAVDQYGLIWSNEGLIADQLLTETLSTSKMVMADNMVTGSIVTKTSDVTADTQACIPLYNSTHTQGNGSVYMYVDGSKFGCQDGKYYVVGLTMFMNNLVVTDKKPVFFGKAKGTSMNASVRADGSFKESPVQIGNNDLRVVFKYDSTAPIMCIYLDAYGRTNNVYWDLSTSDLFVYQLNPISSWFKSKDSFSSGYVPVYEHATGHSVNECIFNNTDGLGIYDVGGLPYLATTEASTIRLDLYTANAKSYKEKQLEARIAALNDAIGNIDTALDNIIALQNSYINGGASS